MLVSCNEENASDTPFDLTAIALSNEYAAYRDLVAERGLYHIAHDTDHDGLKGLLKSMPPGSTLNEVPTKEVESVEGGMDYVEYNQKLTASRNLLDQKFGYLDIPENDRIRLIKIYNELKGAPFETEEFISKLKAEIDEN